MPCMDMLAVRHVHMDEQWRYARSHVADASAGMAEHGAHHGAVAVIRKAEGHGDASLIRWCWLFPRAKT